MKFELITSGTRCSYRDFLNRAVKIRNVSERIPKINK